MVEKNQNKVEYVYLLICYIVYHMI